MQNVTTAKKTYEQGVQDCLNYNYKDAVSNLTEASQQGYPAADLWLGDVSTVFRTNN